MKKLNNLLGLVGFLVWGMALSANAFGQSSGQLLVNEVEFDPPSSSTDGCQYVEIRGANSGGTVPANIWFITIDNSNANPGNIAFASNIGGTTVGANGTITILNSAVGTCPGRVYGPGTTTVNVNLPLGLGFFSSRAFLLVTSATPFVSGQNIDQDQNGQFDFAVTVIDGFAFNINVEEEFNYGGSPQIFAPTTPTTDVPDAVTRFSNNSTPLSVAAFYYGELSASPDETTQYAAPQSPNFPIGGILTPGGTNLPTSVTPQKAVVDFNGDGRTDYSIGRIASNQLVWWSSLNGSGEQRVVEWGVAGDVPVPEDFDGDGNDDVAVWRPGTALTAGFYILQSADSTVRIELFGLTGDDPAVAGDWDGDGKADPAVYRDGGASQQSNFYFRGSQNNPGGAITYLPWGVGGDKPVRGDFDGDAKQDQAVFRSTDNTWYVWPSATQTLSAIPFGLPGDTRVSGDFDGDAKTDLAVYRDGVWYILGSSDGQVRYINWGVSGDLPVSGDYDGDGKTDAAIWRNGVFYIQNSGGSVTYFSWGTTGDNPVASLFNN